MWMGWAGDRMRMGWGYGLGIGRGLNGYERGWDRDEMGMG